MAPTQRSAPQHSLIRPQVGHQALAVQPTHGIPWQVLVEQFRNKNLGPGCGKLLALDEAHK